MKSNMKRFFHLCFCALLLGTATNLAAVPRTESNIPLDGRVSCINYERQTSSFTYTNACGYDIEVAIFPTVEQKQTQHSYIKVINRPSAKALHRVSLTKHQSFKFKAESFLPKITACKAPLFPKDLVLAVEHYACVNKDLLATKTITKAPPTEDKCRLTKTGNCIYPPNIEHGQVNCFSWQAGQFNNGVQVSIFRNNCAFPVETAFFSGTDLKSGIIKPVQRLSLEPGEEFAYNKSDIKYKNTVYKSCISPWVPQYIINASYNVQHDYVCIKRSRLNR